MSRANVKNNVLAENDRIAAEMRRDFNDLGLFVVNLVSSPGSGKTSLLEETIKDGRFRPAVLTGDIQTENDAARLRIAGLSNVLQIVTHGACHLDASMVRSGIEKIDLKAADLLIIENVGNLVCPSSYDLGEDLKVVMISTTEGDDKPLKYPGMFLRSSLMVINKIDLVDHCDCELDRLRDNARSINGSLEVIETSCRDGRGIDRWMNWLAGRIAAKQQDQNLKAER